MIKWGWFLKSFVLWLFTLLISCFTFWVSSFVNAEQIFTLNWEYVIADWLNSNTFSLKQNFNFLINNAYKVFSVYWGDMYPRLWNVFRTEDWLYYIDSCAWGYSCQDINTSIKDQWYFQYYCSTTYQGTCYDDNIPTSSLYNNNNLKNPSAMRLVFHWQSLMLCFDYDSTLGSICFYKNDAHPSFYNSLNITYNPFPNEIGPYNIYPYITNSKFWAPIYWGWDFWNVWNVTWSYSSYTWYVWGSVFQCNQQMALDYYRQNGFTDTLCYSDFQELDWMDWGSWGLNYDDIWLFTANLRWWGRTWENMTESKWFGFWRYAYKTYKMWVHTYSELFDNIPNALPWYFSKLYLVWNDVPTDEILEYCEMSVFNNQNLSSKEYTWVNKSAVCSNLVPWGWWAWGWGSSWWDDSWDWWGWETELWLNLCWLTWTCWDDSWGWDSWGWGWWGWDDNEDWLVEMQNGKSFMTNLNEELSSSSIVPNKSDFWLWILPNYIILALLWLVVFRFLSH